MPVKNLGQQGQPAGMPSDPFVYGNFAVSDTAPDTWDCPRKGLFQGSLSRICRNGLGGLAVAFVVPNASSVDGPGFAGIPLDPFEMLLAIRKPPRHASRSWL